MKAQKAPRSKISTDTKAAEKDAPGKALKSKVSSKVPKKRLDDYDLAKPVQMQLFESLLPNDQQFSNTIEFYDFCPKYVYWRSERVGDKFLDRIERQFECRGSGYRLSIDPAKIKDSDGVVRDYFPGVAEELVEDALRKLAVDGHGLFLDDQAAVTFTLYELQKELSKTGHTIRLNRLKKP